MAYKQKRDKGFYHYLDLIERTARKYEDDLIATGRFTFVRSEGYYRLYKENGTGRIVHVLVPYVSQQIAVSTDGSDGKFQY